MGRLVRRLAENMTGFARAGLGLMFPPRCAHCDAELPGDRFDGMLLCDDCRVLLGPELWPGCPRCGAAGAADSGPAGRCGSCRHTKLRFDTAIPLGGYADDLRGVVLRMKRPAEDTLSAAVGRLLALRRGPQLADLSVDLIVPIPMYWRRRLARGTNSPDIIAGNLGKILGVAVSRRVLARCRNTLPQIDLPPKQRFQNLRGAFRVRPGRRLRGLRIMLVDDILTTGATCSEAAATLKKAGAAMVAAVVIARAQSTNTT